MGPAIKPLAWIGSAYKDLTTFPDSVQTVRFAEAVYVLHSFQKKSRRGIETPRQDIELVRTRLKLAEEEYRLLQSRRQEDMNG